MHKREWRNLVDAQDSGSCARKGVRVRVPPRALPYLKNIYLCNYIYDCANRQFIIKRVNKIIMNANAT